MTLYEISRHLIVFHCSVRSGSEVGNIAAALEVTKSISTQANNTIHLSLIEGFAIKDQELGDLALQVSDTRFITSPVVIYFLAVIR